MRKLALIGFAVMATGGAAHAQDVRGIIQNLDRALNPQEQQRSAPNRADEERYWREYYGNREDWRDRASRDYGYRDQEQTRLDQRDLDRLFQSDGARQIEYFNLSDADRRRYDNATPNERRRWDDEFAENARSRWQRMSDSERRRYLDDVAREEDRMSGSSSEGRRRH